MIRNGFGLISLIGAAAGAFVSLGMTGVAHANELESCGGVFIAKNVFDDPAPYTSGWFALRTTYSHLRIGKLRIRRPR